MSIMNHTVIVNPFTPADASRHSLARHTEIYYLLMFGSLEWGVLQHMEITLDGLIWV